MTQLIQMRQRIKAITTIKKVTHAMRLISMSTHSHLKSRERFLQTYSKTLEQLFLFVKSQTHSWTSPIINPPLLQPKKTLIILVGSQKGLCGNFNTALFKLFDTYQSRHHEDNVAYIGVGKKAIYFLQDKYKTSIIHDFAEFSITHITTTAHAITQHIMHEQYTEVLFINNVIKTFFIQKPQITYLIPFSQTEKTIAPTPTQEYCWEQDPFDILNVLLHQYIATQIYNILFQSLLAEQAARFISMDNSTRNAKKLLEITTFHYNKFRQTKITRELSELAGSFQ